MPLILNGSTGISGIDGSAGTPSYQGTDSDTGLWYPAANTVALSTSGSERLRIDSSGNVGIGTNSPGVRLQVSCSQASSAFPVIVNNTSDVATSINGIHFPMSNGSSGAQIYIRSDASGGDYTMTIANGQNQPIRFCTSSTTERMRIDASGNVGIGTTTITSGAGWSPRLVLDATAAALIVKQSATGQENSFGTGNSLFIDSLGNSTGANNNIIFRNTNVNSSFSALERMRIHAGGNVSIGNTTNTYKLDVTGGIRASTYFYASGANAGDGIYLANGSSNGLISQMSNGSASTLTYIGNQTITTSSDIRIKNNIRPTERNALDLLGQWEIVDHNWNDPSDQCENNRNSRGVWTGVIAQQIQPITPWLVNKPLEDENKDGSKNLWLVDFAYSVPLLVKAIQELKAELDSVKTELNQLKGV